MFGTLGVVHGVCIILPTLYQAICLSSYIIPTLTNLTNFTYLPSTYLSIPTLPTYAYPLLPMYLPLYPYLLPIFLHTSVYLPYLPYLPIPHTTFYLPKLHTPPIPVSFILH